MTWRLLLVLIPILTIANLACATFGIVGWAWYTQSTTIIPAITGALLGIFATHRSDRLRTAITLFIAWAASALLSGVGALLFVNSYNGAVHAPYISIILKYFLWATVIGGSIGVTLFLAVAALRPTRSSPHEAA